MRGEVLQFDEGSGTGTISGDDGTTYGFEVSSIRSALPLPVGQRVDFIAASGSAIEIIALTATLAKTPSEGAQGQSTGVAGGSFDLGRVIQQTFHSIRVNWATFTVISLILVGIPSLVQVFGQTEMILGQMVSGTAWAVVGWVTFVVGACILQGMVVKVTVTGLNGSPMGMGAAFEAGAKLFLPLLGLGIIAGLGTILGYILLIVPGIILSVMWSAAAGALVIEKKTIFESLKRSRDLTRGYRWPIFGLVIIYMVVSLVIGSLVGGVGAATGGNFLDGSTNMGVNMLTTAISNILTSVIGAAGVAALYYELRSVKEGVGPEQLASVFD